MSAAFDTRARPVARHGRHMAPRRRPFSSLLHWRPRSSASTAAPVVTAVPEMEDTLAPLPALVLSAQPATGWVPGQFPGASDTGQPGWPKYDGGKETGPFGVQPWAITDEEPPRPGPGPDPACSAAADTMADPGCTTVTGAPRPFSPVQQAPGPFPVAFSRQYGPDGIPLTRGSDEQVFGAPRYEGLFPCGSGVVAEVSTGTGHRGSGAIAGNSLYLRWLAGELAHAAHQYDLAVGIRAEVAELAQPDPAPVVAEVEAVPGISGEVTADSQSEAAVEVPAVIAEPRERSDENTGTPAETGSEVAA
jgi:hypothetical protein